MEYVLTGQELVLLLVSLIHRSRPEMLTENRDGFVVDFSLLEEATSPLAGDDAMLDKFRAALAHQPAEEAYYMDFDMAEARRLNELLVEFETLEGLDPSVLLLSQSLRTRLQTGLRLV